MRTVLFTTDPSVFRLVEVLQPLGLEVAGVVVPANRQDTAKVRDVLRSSAFPTRLHDRQAPLDLRDMAPEIGISWMYAQILPEALLAAIPRGVLNMHGGTLPAYRGASVLLWAIVSGEERLGITWHSLVKEVDAGPIWAESSIAIDPRASGIDVRQDMIDAGIRLAPEALKRLLDGGPPLRHPGADGRVWPSFTARHRAIRPGMTARQLRDLVRALGDPWPPATFEQQGRQVAITDVVQSPVADAIAYVVAEGHTLYLVGHRI